MKWQQQLMDQPYAYLQKLREEEPIALVEESNERQTYVVTKYDDVKHVLRHVELYSSDKRKIRPHRDREWYEFWGDIERILSQNLLEVDPPHHTRLRKLIHQAFTPKIIRQMDEQVERMSAHLLQSLQARATFDVISEYAFPLPMMVISEMLGIPHRDRDRFKKWSEALLLLDETIVEASTWQRVKGYFSAQQFLRYLSELFAEKRQQRGEDLVSMLVQAESEGERLTEEELYTMVILLIIAGHETTVNLIGNSLHLIAMNPHLREAVLANSDSALDEFLRFESPISLTYRYVVTDHEYGGVTFKRGDYIVVSLASANRDEAKFERANELDVTRKPNAHVAFGSGIHHCIGAPLARLEGKIAIVNFLTTFPQMRMIEAAKWRNVIGFRGLKQLMITTGK